MEKQVKKVKHKYIKCDCCNNKIDITIAREIGDYERVNSMYVYYCDKCGNENIER